MVAARKKCTTPEGVTTASFIIPKVLAHVRAVGGDSERLERAFCLPVGLHANALHTASSSATRNFTEAAETIIDDSLLGLHTAIRQKRGSFGVLDFAVRSVPTVRDAIQRLAKYQRLISNLSPFDAKVRRGELFVTHRIKGDPLGIGRHGHEFTMAVLLKMVRELTGEAIVPKRVTFAHSRSSGTLELKNFFGIDRVEFAGDANMLIFAAEVLDAPILTADADLLEFLDSLTEIHLQPAPGRLTPILDWPDQDQRDYSALVRPYIVDTLKRGKNPSIEHAAEFHRTSVRTLQRRLEMSGTIFYSMVDDVRRELSLLYLGDPRLRVSDVAQRLGYAEVRSFARAFRRWTGYTPAQYRRARIAAKAVESLVEQ
ncbi:AraC family transcriptional regulator [Pendulispora rubella]|uniref:AraC family transcriptional regulator n=1 Tax=Pendulispora rubella TaxID=2741070 RepID=A0ABZ2LHE4_9BACT